MPTRVGVPKAWVGALLPSGAMDSTALGGSVVAPTITGPIQINTTTLRVGISPGSGGATSWTLQKSTDGGTTWTSAGSVTVGATQADATVTTGQSTQLRIAASAGGSPVYSNVVTGVADSGTVITDSFLLANGYWSPQNMPMRVITQRPEAGANAAHLWAHPDLPYDHAILIQGGAPPFHAVLQEAPPWMTDIEFLTQYGGELRPTSTYLRLRGANPTSAGQPTDGWLVRYRVYGQDYARGSSPTTYQEVSFRIKVDPNKFLFIAPSGNNTNAGTIASPRADFAGWYGTDRNTAENFGKIVVFRGGMYDVLGDAVDFLNCAIDANRKPQSFIGYPGENVQWDFTAGAFTIWANTNDFLFQNIKTYGSKITRPDTTPIANARNFAFYNSVHNRVYFDRCEAHEVVPGNPAAAGYGSDNPGWVWSPSTGTNRNSDWGFNEILGSDAGPATGNGPSLFSVSCVDYCTAKMITLRDWAATPPMGEKANGRHWSYQWVDGWAANKGVNGDSIGVLYSSLSNSYDTNLNPGNFEFWYCRADSDSDSSYAVQLAYSAQNGSTRLPTWMTRCSIKGPIRMAHAQNAPIVLGKNVVAGTLQSFGNPIDTSNDNLLGSYSSNYFDSTGNLSGLAATSFGLRGAQIAAQFAE